MEHTKQDIDSIIFIYKLSNRRDHHSATFTWTSLFQHRILGLKKPTFQAGGVNRQQVTKVSKKCQKMSTFWTLVTIFGIPMRNAFK